jgi:hypothetical protein
MKKTKILILFLLIILITSCAVKLIADYDRNTADKIIEISKLVDLFYMNLLDIEPSERMYNEFTEEYKNIEVELRALVMMNKLRTKNEDSTQIAENTLEFWIKYKETHKENDNYTNAKLKIHRKRFNRLFTALAIGEKAKTDYE